MKPQAIDLFAGGGGASCGLNQAGFDVVLAIEKDKTIAAVHHQNHLLTNLNIEDVRNFDFRPYSGIYHIHGSPPCQAFSVATSTEAKKKRLAKGEGDLILEWVRAIKETRPRTASMENVRGAAKSLGFRQACQKLWELGYWLNWEVLNAADFGVPQTRKRLFLRAIRDDALGQLPIDRAQQTLFGEKYWWGMVPIAHRWIGWYEAIADLIPILPPTEPAPWQIKRLPEELKSYLIPDGNQTNPRDKNGTCCYLVPRVGANSRGDLAIREKKQPAPTIRALGHDRHWRQFDAWLENGTFRQLTPRALARLQSFPDSFKLPETNWLAGKIVGNAVPPLMLKKLVEEFARTHYT